MQQRRILWRLAEVIEVVPETPRTKSLLLEVPGWEGHKAGQHVDVRLTAEDGYQAQRSYSIGSAPEDGRLMLTVDRLDDGEVSIYLTDVLMAGDRLELRGPIGGYFTWEAADGGPLFLVGGGSGIAPLMAMIRHRAAAGSEVPTRLLYSSRSYEEIIFREELESLASRDSALEVIHTLTRSRPQGWTGYDRRIDAEMLGEVSWSPDESPLAFVCGPTSTQGATRRNGVQPPAKESAYIRQSCNVWQHPETDDIGSWLRRSRVGAIGPTVRLKLPLILIPL